LALVDISSPDLRQPPVAPMSGNRRRRKYAGVESPAYFVNHVPIRVEVGFHILEILEKKVQAGEKKRCVTPPPRLKWRPMI
jgi:hypothetical protein